MTYPPLPQDVLDFLKENAPDEHLKDDDLTVKRAMAEWGCSEASARAALDDAVLSGKMRKSYKRSEQARVAVYEIVKKGV